MRRHHYDFPTSVDLIVPYRPGDDLRHAHAEKLWDLWDRYFPSMKKYVGVHEETEGLWNKAIATDRAAGRGDGEVLVVADADVWVEPSYVWQAVKLVHGGKPWVIPHQLVHRLNLQSTDAWLAGEPGPLRYDRRPYLGVVGGGMFVISRKGWDEIGGFDPRFRGHSGEDISFGYVADRLLGTHTRLKGDLIHLYHDPQLSKDDDRITGPNQALMREYAQARHSKQALRRLVLEGQASVR